LYHPTKSEFIKLAKGGTLIPVYREIVADMETPVSAYIKIEGEFSFLLESVEGGENIARYSFLGSDPLLIFRSKGSAVEIVENGKKKKITGDPISRLKEAISAFKPVKVKGLPRFHGGFVGYASYDAVRFIENIPAKNPDELNLPEMYFLLADTLLAFDHVKHKIMVISNAFVDGSPAKAYEGAIKKIDKLIKKIEKPLSEKELELEVVESGRPIKVRSNVTKEQFEASVLKAKEYIEAGEAIQVVLSQRFETRISADAFNIYRVLRTINPSPYMYYLKFGDIKLIGSSPEVMVRLEEGRATVRPIAGTRSRGESEEEDKKLEAELLSDEKERAEHLMLVDLARNDLGRVCDYGSITATSLMEVEKYSHVMHIVSNVTGSLLKDKDAFDLFKASFPAGTVTGAPKVRAMEIIDELETTVRGPYAGAVGYFSFAGDLDTCITIRTILVKGSKAYVQAGAGIVFDSVPEKEYQETINKARALIKAIELTGGKHV
jgi:anthranilate synthase component 1